MLTHAVTSCPDQIPAPVGRVPLLTSPAAEQAAWCAGVNPSRHKTKGRKHPELCSLPSSHTGDAHSRYIHADAHLVLRVAPRHTQSDTFLFYHCILVNSSINSSERCSKVERSLILFPLNISSVILPFPNKLRCLTGESSKGQPYISPCMQRRGM